MEKQHITYSFENPNRQETFIQLLRQILLEKLAAQAKAL